MHLDQKRLMLQLPTALLPLLLSSLLLPSSTSAATYNLPSCYLECGRNLTGGLACDLSTGTDCDCTSTKFLDSLGCCIVDNCWISHPSAEFRIPCQDGYVDASCPADQDDNNSTATATATTDRIKALGIATTSGASTLSTSTTSVHATVQVQTNSAGSATATADSSSDGGSDDKSGVIGLGVGLGLGIPALLLAIFLVAYYYRKTKKAEIESQRSSRSRTRVGEKSGRPSSPSTLVGSSAPQPTEKSSVTHRKNSVTNKSARAGRDTALMSELPG